MEERKDNKRIQLASDDVLGEFDTAMEEIGVREKEKKTVKQAALVCLPYIDLTGVPIPQDALGLINKEEAIKNKTACFFYGESNIKIGSTNPDKEEAKKIIMKVKERFFNKKVEIYLISEHSFSALLKAYDHLPALKKTERGVQITEEDLAKYKDVKDFKEITERLKKISVSEILSLLLGAAINIEASDMHIEAGKSDVKIRFRVDGILHDAATLPMEKWDDLIARIKLVSGLKINVTNNPQDGRFMIVLGPGNDIDVRISTLPTAYGESVALRILMFSKRALSLGELGLNQDNFKILEQVISKPNGLILNTGPTGSGKTSTLYAILTKLNKEDVKVVTIEDPIEYHLDGINQSQTDEVHGYTFAKALKSFVRQDPDVIMVGEIRDFDTADTAIQSALTGHLVLSTVHTNSAAGSVPRLMSMGAKNFLVAPAINAIIGQRLVRRVCESCKEKTFLTEEQKEKIKKIFLNSAEKTKEKINLEKLDEVVFYEGRGCEKCGNIGYKGRIAIFEIIEFEEKTRRIITDNENVSEEDIEKKAIEKGMVTMAQDGIFRAMEGVTSLDEVFRVVG